MEIKTEKGFILLRNGRGPVYVALHAGPSLFDSGATRDTGADKIASLCWEKTGGSLVLFTLPRDQSIGIDSNRDIPAEKESMNTAQKKNIKFLNRYGWIALSSADYKKRKKIYENFWKTVAGLGEKFFLFHTEDSRLSNFPSILDLITFDYKGVKKELIEKAVDALNSKYRGFFSKINKFYRKRIVFENIMDAEKTVSRNTPVRKELFRKELAKISRFAGKEFARKLEMNADTKNFIAAVKYAVKNGPMPVITIEQNFSGKKAIAPKKFLLGRGTVLELEINKFMCEYFPQKTADIILDLIGLLEQYENK